MLLFEQPADITMDPFSHFPKRPGEVLFLDIETTGFSPETSYVYLIGCAYFCKGEVRVRQWLMEDAAQEKEMLAAFVSFAKNFHLLVHYNGDTFDIPYLTKKCKRYHIANVLPALGSADLYKALLPIKKILPLPDLKQKTLEGWLGIRRQDRFSGGDLIPVYREFLARSRYETLTKGEGPAYASPNFQESGLASMPESPAKSLLYVLLLHNREDIMGLMSISPLLAMPELLSGSFSIKGIQPSPVGDPGFSMEDCGNICFSLGYGTMPFPPDCTFQHTVSHPLPPGGIISLSIGGDGSLSLSVPVFHGMLKYFFEDYKEYYYLPEEDRAIHKSIAGFVDKAYRKKATKETCYQKQEGSFLPQAEPIFMPSFRETTKAPISYFEPTAMFWEGGVQVEAWLLSLLRWLWKQL